MIPEGRSPQGIVGSGTSQPQPRYHPALAFIFHPFTHTQPHTQPHTQQKRRVPHPSRPHHDGWERTPFPRPLLQLLASNIPATQTPFLLPSTLTGYTTCDFASSSQPTTTGPEILGENAKRLRNPVNSENLKTSSPKPNKPFKNNYLDQQK